jgi:hypothetical protein
MKPVGIVLRSGEGKRDEGEWWRGWIYDVDVTYVDVTVYPPCTTIIKYYKKNTGKPNYWIVLQ